MPWCMEVREIMSFREVPATEGALCQCLWRIKEGKVLGDWCSGSLGVTSMSQRHELYLDAEEGVLVHLPPRSRNWHRVDAQVCVSGWRKHCPWGVWPVSSSWWATVWLVEGEEKSSLKMETLGWGVTDRAQLRLLRLRCGVLAGEPGVGQEGTAWSGSRGWDVDGSLCVGGWHRHVDPCCLLFPTMCKTGERMRGSGWGGTPTSVPVL